MRARHPQLSAAPIFIQTGPQWRFTARPGLGGLGYSASLLDDKSKTFDPSVNDYALTDAQSNLDSSSLNFDTNFFSDDSQNIGDYIKGGSYDPNYYGSGGASSAQSDVASGIASFFKTLFGAMGPPQARPVTPVKAPVSTTPSWVPWVLGGGAAVLAIGGIAAVVGSRKK